jgi:polysaccharide biosynthesis transport protein
VSRNLGRAVLVASAQPREGRTTLAISLARLAALSGRRAIIIDCDLRRPTLHNTFGEKIGPGLTDLLQRRLEVGQAIRRDGLTPLDYIPGGHPAPHAVDLLCHPEMSRLLATLRTAYDLVILDSPPSATVADTSYLAQMADEFLFVVSWNKTPWRLVREQMEELAQHNPNLTGVILNQVDMRQHAKYRPTMVGVSGRPRIPRSPPLTGEVLGSAG